MMIDWLICKWIVAFVVCVCVCVHPCVCMRVWVRGDVVSDWSLIVLNQIVLQPDVFASCVNISDKKLTPHGVCVLWEWEWIEDMELFEPSIENQEDSDHDTQNSTESEVPPSSVPTIPVTHTVTFKCIGTVRSPAYQNTLKKSVRATYRGTWSPY